MIRKPSADWGREDAAVALARSVAASGAAAARTGAVAVRMGAEYLRAMVCLAFAGLWGFAALAAGMGDAGRC